MAYKIHRLYFRIYRHHKHIIGENGVGTTIITTQAEIYTHQVIGITGLQMNTITTIMDPVVVRIIPSIIIKGQTPPS